MNEPWNLASSTWSDVRSNRYEVAVLPWGATEAHNHHLPYATDTIQCNVIAVEAARKAWDRGGRVVVLPTVPFGVQTGQQEIPFCINLNPSTQAIILADIVESLELHGIRKLVILNGHGGNDFKQMIRELAPRTEILLCQVNWYAAVDPGSFFDEPGDHAGELETSVMLHIAPALVAPLSTAGPGAARPFRIRAFGEKWAWTPRHWIRVTDDTGVGDPRAATAEKGRRFFDAVTDRLGEFFADLTELPDPEQLYGQ